MRAMVDAERLERFMRELGRRGVSIGRRGPVEFLHFDYRAQALSKLARGHDRDLADVRAMIERGAVSREALRAALDEIDGRLVRYPGLDAEAFRRRARAFLGASDA